MKPNRRPISRDTRQLLAIAAIAVAALWVLARIRFPDRAPTPNPVPPVLAQLTPPSAFDDISTSVAELEPRVQASMLAVDLRHDDRDASGEVRSSASALRFRDDLAVAAIAEPADVLESSESEAVEVARDPASQLVVIRVSSGTAPPLPIWSPRRLGTPRFLVSAVARHEGIALRPFFVGWLSEILSPTWSAPVWALPPATDLPAGAFVFSIDGALVGLAVEREGQPMLVPSEALFAMAERLVRDEPKPRGRLGIEVQPLTSAISASNGALTGVVVTWVDPQGPAAGHVNATDVIEAIDGEKMTTLEHWTAHTARLSENQLVVLRVRWRDEVHDVVVTTAPVRESDDRPLGLTLRTVPNVGALITQIEPGSQATRSGLQVGDVLTVVGDIESPTAAQASRAFASIAREHPILLGVTRGNTHRVVALERTW